MAEPSEEKLKLADAEVTLTRNVQLKTGAQQWGTGNHMVVEHFLGNREDVMIVSQDAEIKVKRLVPKIDFTSSSPHTSTTSRAYHDFADVKPEDEKRLLAIYNKFAK
jgi:hypothetical protein